MNTTTTMTVSLTQSRYGKVPEPQIMLRFPKGTSDRLINAAIHRLAADVELGTPANEGWLVQTEICYNNCGRVYLELAESTVAEAERAMAILNTVVG